MVLTFFAVGRAESTGRPGGIDPPEVYMFLWDWLFFRAPSDNELNQSEFYFGGIIYRGARSAETSPLLQSVDVTGPNPDYFYFGVELPQDPPLDVLDLALVVTEVEEEGREAGEERNDPFPVELNLLKKYITLDPELAPAQIRQMLQDYDYCEDNNITWQQRYGGDPQQLPTLAVRKHKKVLLDITEPPGRGGDTSPWFTKLLTGEPIIEVVEPTTVRIDDLTLGISMTGRALKHLEPQELEAHEMGTLEGNSTGSRKGADFEPRFHPDFEVTASTLGLKDVQVTLINICDPEQPVATTTTDSRGYFQFRFEQMGSDGTYRLHLEHKTLSADLCIEYEEAHAPISLGGIRLQEDPPGLICQCP